MVNGTDVRGSDERFAALDERVTNLRSSFQSLDHATQAGFSRIDAKLAEMSAAFSAGQRTPWAQIWPAAAVGVSVLVALGWLVYSPIKDSQTKLESSLTKLSDIMSDSIKDGPNVYVTRRENEPLRQRSAEDRTNTLQAITDLRQSSLPRAEWMLRNNTVDAALADKQREIDQLRQDFGGTYSLRDALVDFKNRLERIELKETRP